MNWLEILIIALIAIMALIGYGKGFIKMIVGLVAMVIALCATAVLAPMLSDYINNETQLRQQIASSLEEYLTEQIGEQLEQSTEAAQQAAVENLMLPETVRDALLKNNTLESYQALGVSTFSEYVSNFVAKTGIVAIAYLIVFLVLYIVLRIVFKLLNVVTLLPFLKGVNRLAGALLGLFHALVYVWVFFCIATALLNTGWGMSVMAMIDESVFLSMLYRSNIILSALMG